MTMSPDDEAQWIAETVRQTYREAGVAWPPEPGAGPVPLGALLGAYPIVHEEIDGLNHGAVSASLRRWDIRWNAIPDPDPALAGFLYATSQIGHVFVRRNDALPRRRFTAAHELGHFRLHREAALVDGAMIQADVTITETAGAELASQERQANRFAADLILPGPTCRALYDHYRQKYGPSSRFIIEHMAADLLVSREAVAWRLYALGRIERPGESRRPTPAAQEAG